MSRKGKIFLIVLLFIISSAAYLLIGRGMKYDGGAGVILQLRAVRLIAAVSAGGILAFTGALIQGLLQNPLTDPYILGVSGGALLGSAFSSVFFRGNPIASVLFSFLFGFSAFLCTLLISKAVKGDRLYSMIVSGIMVSIFTSSSVVLLHIFSGRGAVELFYSLMGSLNIVIIERFALFYIVLLILLAGLIIFLFMRSARMDVMSAGYEVAFTSGIDYRKEFALNLIISSFLVSVVVSFTGIIGFIGIMVPHIAKRIVKPRFAEIYSVSFIFGAMLLLAADFAAKNFTSFEIPVGVITSLAGIPFFIFLLRGAYDN